jgi:hypothetical protein
MKPNLVIFYVNKLCINTSIKNIHILDIIVGLS